MNWKEEWEDVFNIIFGVVVFLIIAGIFLIGLIGYMIGKYL